MRSWSSDLGYLWETLRERTDFFSAASATISTLYILYQFQTIFKHATILLRLRCYYNDDSSTDAYLESMV